MKFTSIVINDDRVILSILSDLVAVHGIDVLERGKDGNNALKFYKKHRPDLVFTDIEMPHHGDTLREIKKSNPDAIVIMITDEDNPMRLDMINDLHADAILYKPFSIDSLKKIITSLTTNPKNMISLAIQKVLLEMNAETLPKVQERLSKDYNCNLFDCFENPEYLNRILKDLYGNSHKVIVDSISKKLDEFKQDEKISKFILEIGR